MGRAVANTPRRAGHDLEEERQVAVLRIFILLLVKVAAGEAAQAFLNLFGKQRLIAEIRHVLEDNLVRDGALVGENFPVAFDDHDR